MMNRRTMRREFLKAAGAGVLSVLTPGCLHTSTQSPAPQRRRPPNIVFILADDLGVGMIRDKLRELGLSRNTILIFTGDNGGEGRVTSNAPWRAGKSTLYEGGLREPLIIHWPGVARCGGICHAPVCTMDFYPTLADIARCAPRRSQIADGVSLVPTLRDPAVVLDRETLYWHYPLEKAHFLGGRSVGAIRKGDWKLLEFFDTGELELYDLAEDPGEQHDLADRRADKRTELADALRTWRQKVGAAFPTGQPVQASSDRALEGKDDQ